MKSQGKDDHHDECAHENVTKIQFVKDVYDEGVVHALRTPVYLVRCDDCGKEFETRLD